MKDDFDGSIGMTLHLLRNPYGRDPEVLRRARILAAALIEESLVEIETQIGKKHEAEKKAVHYEEALKEIAEAAETSWGQRCDVFGDIARMALRD